VLSLRRQSNSDHYNPGNSRRRSSVRSTHKTRSVSNHSSKKKVRARSSMSNSTDCRRSTRNRLKQKVSRSQQKTRGSLSDRNEDISSLYKYGRGFGLLSRNRKILAFSSETRQKSQKEFRILARSNTRKQDDLRSQKSLKSVPKD